jgi:2-polyprenyl-3-methyl-5-hydroxy-6-metoxy-1,4-benzoquinol methylase
MKTKKQNFDQAAASWDQEPGRVRLADDIAQAIIKERIVTPDMDVMDFGCGTGLLTLRLQPFVHSITGVDSSQGMLDVLKLKIKNMNLSNVKAKCLDIEKGGALQGSYHLIVSSMTLHHIKKITPLFGQFHKVLTFGGYLCIADLDLDDGKFHGNNEGVFHFGFDRVKLRRALLHAGFWDIKDLTASQIMKPIGDGGEHMFSIFLLTGRKRP